jgi:hypothetical protein
MSDGALLLFDAFDAAAAIWRALLVWIVVGAVVGTAVVLGSGVATVYAWRAVSARLRAAHRPEAPRIVRLPERPSEAPRGASTDTPPPNVKRSEAA